MWNCSSGACLSRGATAGGGEVTAVLATQQGHPCHSIIVAGWDRRVGAVGCLQGGNKAPAIHEGPFFVEVLMPIAPMHAMLPF